MPFLSWKIILIFSSLGTSALVPFLLPNSISVFGNVDKKQGIKVWKGGKELNDVIDIPVNAEAKTVVSEKGGGEKMVNNGVSSRSKKSLEEATEKPKPQFSKANDSHTLRFWGIGDSNITGIISSGTYTTNLACCDSRISGSYNQFLINSQLNNHWLKYSNNHSHLLVLQFSETFGNIAEFLSKYSNSWIEMNWAPTFSSWPVKWIAQKIKNNGVLDLYYQIVQENGEGTRNSLSRSSIFGRNSSKELETSIVMPREDSKIFLVEVPKDKLNSMLVD